MVKTPNVDEKAPDFDLPRDGGSQLRLSSLAGKKVVLYFYPKDDTPGCTLEGREFSAARSEFSAADAVVIGLSADSVARHDKFKAKHDLDIALVSDEDHEALNAYGQGHAFSVRFELNDNPFIVADIKTTNAFAQRNAAPELTIASRKVGNVI